MEYLIYDINDDSSLVDILNFDSVEELIKYKEHHPNYNVVDIDHFEDDIFLDDDEW